jgi:hypothetical protein
MMMMMTMMSMKRFSILLALIHFNAIEVDVVSSFSLTPQYQKLTSISKSSYEYSTHRRRKSITEVQLSDWSDFAAIEDDDDLLFNSGSDSELGPPGKMQGYADENDPQEYKAEIGSTIEGPEVDWFGEPLFLPVGSVIPLTEENVQGVLAACREEIGTMFGYSAENRGVGITGGVDFVDFDGPSIILKLKGRFWHQRPTVLDRVEKYIQGRIPEVIECYVEDPWELTDEANDLAD